MIDVAILGATGTVGQKFVSLLQGHPQLKIKELIASERSAGMRYDTACTWKQSNPIPDDIAEMIVKPLHAPLESPLLFSGLDSSVAFEAERHYAKLGHIIVSNSKNHRMEPTVPLVIPEVNYLHLNAIKDQQHKGSIITNPNCSTIGLCIALAPLHQQFGIKKLIVHTMQAVSGAGYPGVPSLDILGNVVPFIDGEEKKIEIETKKILGSYTSETGFAPADISVSAHCNRVAVYDGHTENISIEFIKKPSEAAIIKAWKLFSSFPQEQKLHTAPKSPIHYQSIPNRPQPTLDALREHGMATSVGRLRPCNILDYKFTIVSHNTIRGAAGAAILNAETLIALNLL